MRQLSVATVLLFIVVSIFLIPYTSTGLAQDNPPPTPTDSEGGVSLDPVAPTIAQTYAIVTVEGARVRELPNTEAGTEILATLRTNSQVLVDDEREPAPDGSYQWYPILLEQDGMLVAGWIRNDLVSQNLSVREVSNPAFAEYLAQIEIHFPNAISQLPQAVQFEGQLQALDVQYLRLLDGVLTISDSNNNELLRFDDSTWQTASGIEAMSISLQAETYDGYYLYSALTNRLVRGSLRPEWVLPVSSTSPEVAELLSRLEPEVVTEVTGHLFLQTETEQYPLVYWLESSGMRFGILGPDEFVLGASAESDAEAALIIEEFALQELDQTLQRIGEGEISVDPRSPVRSESGIITTVETRAFANRFPTADNTMLTQEEYLRHIEATLIFNALNTFGNPEARLGDGFDMSNFNRDLYDEIYANPESFIDRLEDIRFQVHSVEDIEDRSSFRLVELNLADVLRNGIVIVRLGNSLDNLRRSWIPPNRGANAAVVADNRGRLIVVNYRSDVNRPLNETELTYQERVTFDFIDYREASQVVLQLFHSILNMPGSRTADAIMPMIQPYLVE